MYFYRWTVIPYISIMRIHNLMISFRSTVTNSSVINTSLYFGHSQNFQDSEAEKAIMGSIVYCIHHKDGCKWSDELRKLKVNLLQKKKKEETDVLLNSQMNFDSYLNSNFACRRT